MAGAKSIIFELFATDHASKVFEKVGATAEATAATVKTSSAGLAGMAAVGRTAFLGISGAAVLAGAVSLKAAGNFQQQMTLLQTGAGESAKNIKAVGSGILKMAGDTGTSAKELAQGMYLIESAGYHGADGLNVLKAAAQGAKADGADLEVVGDALTTVMRDIHAPTSSAAEVMSKMVVAVGAGKMRMDDLAASIHSVLPNASALHIGFDQVAGALATMTSQGISADQASQNLNHAIVHLAAPTLGMTKAMASYGLSATDLAKNLGTNGLTGTLSKVEEAILKHMGPAGLTLRSAFNESKEAAADAKKEMAALPPSLQGVAKAYADGTITTADWRKEIKGLPVDQANLLRQFKATQDGAHGFAQQLRSGGQDAQTFSGALKAVMGDQTGLQVALHLSGENADIFAANVKKVAAATAQADGNVRDWHEVQHNFNQQMDRAKETITAAAISLGTVLIPYVQQGIAAFAAFTHLLGEHTTATTILIGAVGALGAVFVGAYAAMLAARVAATIASGAAVVASAAETAAIVALYTAEYIGAAATKAMAAGQWLLNAALDANPIGIVVVAIAALAAGIIYAYKHSETFRNIVNAAWGAVKTAVGAAASFITNDVIPPLVSAFNSVVSAAGKVLNGVRTAFNAVVSFVNGLPGRVFDALSNLAELQGKFLAWFLGALKGAVTAVGSLLGFVATIPGKILGALGNLGGLLLSVGSDIVSGLVHGIESGVGRIAGAVSGLIGHIPGVAKKLLGIASPSKVTKKIGEQVIDGLVNGLESGHSKITTVTARLSGLIQKYLTGAAESKAIATLKAQTSDFNSASTALAKASDRVTTAKKALSDALKTRNDYAGNLSSSLRGEANPLDALSGLGNDAAGNPNKPTPTTITDYLFGKLTALKGFSANLTALASGGLSRDLIAQIASGGLGTGAATASQLLAGGENFSTVNSLQEQIKAVTNQIGNSQADSLYGADVTAAGETLSRVELQEKRAADRLDTLAEDMGKSVVRELKAAGVKVMVGV